jgi:GT2 family glycosyltransferase
MKTQVAVVAIGRNEGDRLIACMDSLQGRVDQIVYVDSGSSDNSVAEATARGADVLALDMTIPFTAARARNAGLARLGELGALPEYVQFLDGDCILQDGWIETARSFLDATPHAAAACGRNHERFPERSVYNRLADVEWDTPIGKSDASGGNVMMRVSALEAAGGFNEAMIAGEEPELCLRLRAMGWEIWRLDAAMTFHDANLLHFRQWWQRAKRGGYATAEAVAMHGKTPERYGVANLKRIIGWGMALPALIVLGMLFVSPWIGLGVLIWPLQMLRRRLKGDPWFQAVFITLAKFPEAQGVFTYLRRRMSRAQATLIEHK